MGENLDRLRARLTDIRNMQHAMAVLRWDQQTYMPPGGATARGAQLATLSRMQHELFVADEIGEWLATAAEEVANEPYDSDDASLVRVTQRDWENARQLPAEFVAEVVRHSAVSQPLWAQARATNDYASFAPALQKTIELSRRTAEYRGYEDSPYDALLDRFEPGMKAAQVRTIFGDLKAQLVPLVAAIAERSDRVSDAPVHGPFPEAQQEEFGKAVVAAFGYDFTRGRQDRTVHPFATGFSRNDVRITTRFDSTFLNPALFGTMHESGHAMYEQGIAPELDSTPLGGGTSLGVHESQSRLWENVVGRSRAVWEHFYPRLRQTFPDRLRDVSLDDFYRAINKVKPSFIRVEADEVTYTLHIMLRFEMEQGLLDGSIGVGDAPHIWNEKMQEYLGITPPNDTLGILQDVHWSTGMMGYFPTYALGTILSLQLYETALQAHPTLQENLRGGDFAPLLGWLTENIYRHGRKYEPNELIQRATGRPLEIGPYVRYLTSKFGEIYGLE
jgi:carboxypeptidase Taq